jgi:16S rRNA (uracil1498-N3)-methyltransferase
MRIPRIYQNSDLSVKRIVSLDEDASRHVGIVLRLKKEDKIILFNGDGQEYLAHIIEIKRQSILVKIISCTIVDNESPLKIHLAQVISKGERMDFVIQKATELGITEITPLFSTRSVVQLKDDRLAKKVAHWYKISIAAAEQCGRVIIPKLNPPQKLIEWVHENQEVTKLLLDVNGEHKMAKLKPQTQVTLLAGPEGGFTEEEVAFAKARGFLSIQLGPRILRTETAALVALAILQGQMGDI